MINVPALVLPGGNEYFQHVLPNLNKSESLKSWTLLKFISKPHRDTIKNIFAENVKMFLLRNKWAYTILKIRY